MIRYLKCCDSLTQIVIFFPFPADDIPPPITDNPRASLPLPVEHHQTKPALAEPPITIQPTDPHSTVRQNWQEEYLPLSECSSGNKSSPNRQDSVDDVPDEHAPPPPVKEGHNDMDNDVFHPSTYDTPKRCERGINSIYKVPPPRVITPDHNDAQDPYDVPPPTHHSPSSPRSSSSDSQKVDSAYSSQDVYDVPPTTHPSVPRMGDVPPRPPPPKSYIQEPYMNLPSNSHISSKIDLDKVVPPSALDKHCSLGSYDIPPPKLTHYDRPKASTLMNGDIKSVSPNSVPPPPTKCSTGTSHSYINAGKGYVQPHVDGENNYLPMEGNRSRNNSDSVYHDMSGGHDPYLDMTPGGHHQVEYDTPPARPPRVSPKPSTTQGKLVVTPVKYLYQVHCTGFHLATKKFRIDDFIYIVNCSKLLLNSLHLFNLFVFSLKRGEGVFWYNVSVLHVIFSLNKAMCMKGNSFIYCIVG